jgi:undecaprenyl-diphosphatase
MPEWLSVALLGVVEGVTEFLPVSSTGHLLLAQHWLAAQSDMFNIVIQAGAVLAVLPLFRARLATMLSLTPEGRAWALRVLVSFFITAVGGLVLDKLDVGLPDESLPIGIALLLGGVAFFAAEHVVERRTRAGLVPSSTITWGVAVAVAAAQLLAAVFPGTSRSGATIVVMLLLGVSRVVATEFTFLVGIPTILAASAYKILKALKADGGAGEDWPMVGLGFVVSAAVSFVVVKWLLGYVQSHSFRAFGAYRIVMGTIILFVALA